MEIVVGTYEELLLGYSLVFENDEYKLEQTFTDHSHMGCVKCLACQRNLLVSGSTDESIRIFDLKKRRELGTLHQHTGTVTSLAFYQRSHLFSTSEDGTLCVWKVSGWEPVRTFKGHKGAVNCVSIHPSGKLGLTVSHDRTLRLWNLVDGRPAFTSNIKHDADIVVWSPEGNFYVVSWNTTINAHSLEDGSVHSSIIAAKRVNSVVFIKDNIIAYAGEGGDIFFHDIMQGTQLTQLSTGTSRIRGLAVSRSHENPSDPSELWLSAASSEGYIHVYRISVSQNGVTPELLTSHDTTFRLTCITTTKPDLVPAGEAVPSVRQKRKAGKPVESSPKKVMKEAALGETETKKPHKMAASTEQTQESKQKEKRGKLKASKKVKKEKKQVEPEESPHENLVAVEDAAAVKDSGPAKTKKKVKFGEVNVREIASRRQLPLMMKELLPGQTKPHHGKLAHGKASKRGLQKQKKAQRKMKRLQKLGKRRP